MIYVHKYANTDCLHRSCPTRHVSSRESPGAICDVVILRTLFSLIISWWWHFQANTMVLMFPTPDHAARLEFDPEGIQFVFVHPCSSCNLVFNIPWKNWIIHNNTKIASQDTVATKYSFRTYPCQAMELWTVCLPHAEFPALRFDSVRVPGQLSVCVMLAFPRPSCSRRPPPWMMFICHIQNLTVPETVHDTTSHTLVLPEETNIQSPTHQLK